MKIERKNDELIVTINPGNDPERNQLIMEFLRYQEIAAKQIANQEEIDRLAESINEKWWVQNKHRFIE